MTRLTLQSASIPPAFACMVSDDTIAAEIPDEARDLRHLPAGCSPRTHEQDEDEKAICHYSLSDIVKKSEVHRCPVEAAKHKVQAPAGHLLGKQAGSHSASISIAESDWKATKHSGMDQYCSTSSETYAFPARTGFDDEPPSCL